jgi:hypothetical protein
MIRNSEHNGEHNSEEKSADIEMPYSGLLISFRTPLNRSLSIRFL